MFSAFYLKILLKALNYHKYDPVILQKICSHKFRILIITYFFFFKKILFSHDFDSSQFKILFAASLAVLAFTRGINRNSLKNIFHFTSKLCKQLRGREREKLFRRHKILRMSLLYSTIRLIHMQMCTKFYFFFV